jgi:hypothetical protein
MTNKARLRTAMTTKLTNTTATMQKLAAPKARMRRERMEGVI